jgi:ubiquinone/menaquinone biosynthesis C-methylase UbiE
MDEHHHIFDPKHVEILESKIRKTWQNRQEIIELLKLKPSYVVADLGCGSGYFTVPISRIVKKIYGIDIQKEMLDYLKQKIQNPKILNIKTLHSKENKIPLQNESIDLLLTVNTLHEFRNRELIINEIRRVIKTKGKVAIVDFKKEETDFGPPVSIRISKEEAISLFEQQDLTVINSHNLKYHYLVIFGKT